MMEVLGMLSTRGARHATSPFIINHNMRLKPQTLPQHFLYFFPERQEHGSFGFCFGREACS